MVEALLLAVLMAGAEEGPAAPVPPTAPVVEAPALSKEAPKSADAKPLTAAPAIPVTVVKPLSEAQKSDAKDTSAALTAKSLHDKATAAEAARIAEEMPPTPSLGEPALCSELRRAAADRVKGKGQLDEERKALALERSRLEKLQAEVTAARAALREETQRLEALVQRDKEPREHHAVAAAPALAASAVPASVKLPLAAAKPEEKPALESVVKTVKAMNPEQAAALVSHLDRALAADVLRRMKPADAGAVMEKLKPDLAAELVSAMATSSATPAASAPKGIRL